MWTSLPCRAGVIYPLANGGILDNDGAGSTAVFPADNVSGVVGTITTQSVVGTAGAANLNENSSALGIDSGLGNENSSQRRVFDVSESWTFSWDVESVLDSIDFNALSGSEAFEITSGDWIGKSFTIAPAAGSSLAFDNTTGTLTFTDGLSNDQFDLTTLVSGGSLEVTAGTPYTFAQTVTGGVEIGQFVFSVSTVPEPSSWALMGLGLVALCAYGWRQRRKQAT